MPASRSSELGIESVMVNSNPETVSTDYDTSDMLFFEPLTVEDVLNICDRVQPDGVIVQFGGQTPLNLARRLSDAGVPIIGTSVDAIEAAEDREKFQQLLHKLGLRQPPNGIARTMDEARREAAKIGYPVLVRPSFVLGGRAMEICYDASQLERFVAEAFVVAEGQPVLIDSFLEDATEVDVDCISDGERCHRAGHHGAHRGSRHPLGRLGVCDSAVQFAGPGDCGDSRGDGCAGEGAERRWADERAVRGAMERPAPSLGGEGWGGRVRPTPSRVRVYVLEVNPRASRTVPFVAKATGMPVAKIAAKVMAGVSLAEQGITERSDSVARFGEGSRVPVHQVLGRRYRAGPGDAIDRRSDGRERRFSMAFAKSQLAAGTVLPSEGNIFISVADRHKAPFWNLLAGSWS